MRKRFTLAILPIVAALALCVTAVPLFSGKADAQSIGDTYSMNPTWNLIGGFNGHSAQFFYANPCAVSVYRFDQFSDSWVFVAQRPSSNTEIGAPMFPRVGYLVQAVCAQ